MAGIIPTDTTTTPTDQAAPVQPTQPQDTSAAPAPNTAPAPADGGSGLPTAPAATGPATAPASTLPPSTSSGTHGILANIALGALSGAAVALKKGAGAPGKAWNGYMSRTPYNQRIQMGNLEMQEKQQQMEQAKKKAQQEEVAAMDEHQIKQLTLQDASMDHLHKIAENAHIESMYPDQEAEERGKLIDQHRTQDTADRAFLTTLEEAGVHIDTKPMSEFTPADGKSIGSGQQTVVNNGKTGKDAGGGFVSNTELESTVLPHDVKVVSDWNLDPKTGTMNPVYKTLAAGQNTAMDALIAHDAGMDKFNELQKQYKSTLDDAKTKAAIAESQGKTVQEYADAEKAKAEAKQALMGASLGNPTLKGQAFLDSLPPMQKNIVGGLLRYQVAPADLGRSKDRAVMIGAAIQADPNAGKPNEWSEAQYKERFGYLQDYGSSSKGDGATRSRLNTAVGHLALLKQAGDALAQNDIPKINQIANTLGVAVGQSPALVYDAIAEKAGGEIAGAVKGGGASATDPALEKAQEHLQHDMSPGQRQDVLSAQGSILKTMQGTIAGKFQQIMGSTPDEFGQPVLYGGNDQLLNSIISGGGQGGGQPQPGIPHNVIMNGQVIGTTTDGGKTMTPVISTK
jgi:hypothetical protein